LVIAYVDNPDGPITLGKVFIPLWIFFGQTALLSFILGCLFRRQRHSPSVAWKRPVVIPRTMPSLLATARKTAIARDRMILEAKADELMDKEEDFNGR